MCVPACVRAIFSPCENDDGSFQLTFLLYIIVIVWHVRIRITSFRQLYMRYAFNLQQVHYQQTDTEVFRTVSAPKTTLLSPFRSLLPLISFSLSLSIRIFCIQLYISSSKKRTIHVLPCWYECAIMFIFISMFTKNRTKRIERNESRKNPPREAKKRQLNDIQTRNISNWMRAGAATSAKYIHIAMEGQKNCNLFVSVPLCRFLSFCACDCTGTNKKKQQPNHYYCVRTYITTRPKYQLKSKASWKATWFDIWMLEQARVVSTHTMASWREKNTSNVYVCTIYM